MDIAAITSLEEKIIKSEENSNGIVDLLHCIEVNLSCSRVGKEVLALCPCMQAPNEEVVSAAVSAVGRVFSSLLERHYSWFSSVERKAVGGNEVALRYQKWMKKKYQMALQMLVQLLARPSLQVTVTQLSHDLMMTRQACCTRSFSGTCTVGPAAVGKSGGLFAASVNWRSIPLSQSYLLHNCQVKSM